MTLPPGYTVFPTADYMFAVAHDDWRNVAKPQFCTADAAAEWARCDKERIERAAERAS